MTVGGYHFLQLAHPDGAFQFLSKASFDDFEHGPNRRGGARRRAQHSCERAVGSGHKFRAEFQNAAVHGILLDNLHALAGDFNLPILLVRVWKILAKRGEALLGSFEDLAYQNTQ